VLLRSNNCARWQLGIPVSVDLAATDASVIVSDRFWMTPCGRHRWVVERTLAWLLGCRRLGVRYERRFNLLQGLSHLACALICLNFLAPTPR
jgi:hypothetical protein